MADRRLALDDGALVDALERLVRTGLVADGSVVLTLAGVDLARLDLRLMLTATAGQPAPGGRGAAPAVADPRPARPVEAPAPWPCAPVTPARGPALRDWGQAAPAGTPRAGLAGLVLAVVDLVRRLLERLALARMEAGELSATEVERLGRALMSLEEQTEALAEMVGGAVTTRV
ncbi:gas vesicle protein GvpJ [Phytohabitans sp. ZYX-F-186]|uniref:Gas vesicle protein GvpJ n=1 Tax=Phytohabitans maris TaxID=3071409 RepID=A0ABU0ZTS2_9ACTN|nr:gas vesicle protein GvpJ [Phytohabitans sp. ZYX-F-186]MDQ7910436.1 gas vesicle protein GvpJ [Phytohabitans sp. ZYX-F-186]